ncbi:tetratricopeptide repeat protein [Salisediminibacterium halotolerans]|uniref:Tetratricopeptide repeat-containing protein n=1 Tax=Salisediminibacterium halotolerans TaxID=517425 RepID=A0A1H9W1Q8_9BACI|nr:tetratricopeptide repeat protein [Salisediminibacterium haloalkalitolerans]SES27443.1 Tetratricopeptide repeat-containing protein [Salisediminibacterium haloalkalitolerans]
MSRSRDNDEKKAPIIPIARDAQFFFNKGNELLENNQPERALRFMQRAMAADPNHPAYACQTAILLSETGRYEESNELLYYIYENLDSTNNESFFFRANNFIAMNRFEEAGFELTLYIQNDPNGQYVEDAKAYLALLHEHEQAENETAASAEVQSDNALRLLVCGDYQAAEETARKQLEKDPQQSCHYAYLAEALIEQKRLAEAEEIVAEWIPFSYGPQFHCLLARLLFEQNKVTREEAAALLSKIHPLHRGDYYYWGRMLLRFDLFELAFKVYMHVKISREAVKDFSFYHELALLVWRNRSAEEAEEIWQWIQQNDREYPPVVREMLTQVQKREFPADIERVLPYA